MAERRLRYSERKKLAETGSLGDLSDVPSLVLRQAVVHLLSRVTGRMLPNKADIVRRHLQDECEEHFGWHPNTELTSFLAGTNDTDAFLDVIEICVETGAQTVVHRDSDHYPTKTVAWPTAEDDLNRLFERHRFGYRIAEGDVHKIGSPVLDAEVVGPALLSVQQPGWEEVELRFKEALDHQRGPSSENDDALTAAGAALEAGLKAKGYKGNTLGALAVDFRKRNTGEGALAGTAESLEKLLKSVAGLRNTLGDAHASDPDADDVSQQTADLAVHLTGSFLVYLSSCGGAA